MNTQASGSSHADTRYSSRCTSVSKAERGKPSSGEVKWQEKHEPRISRIRMQRPWTGWIVVLSRIHGVKVVERRRPYSAVRYSEDFQSRWYSGLRFCLCLNRVPVLLGRTSCGTLEVSDACRSRRDSCYKPPRRARRDFKVR